MAPLVVHEVKLGENGSPEPAKMVRLLQLPMQSRAEFADARG